MTKSPEAFRTISEVAEEVGVEAHVLRFWESRFPQIKPLKRGGGRRYYRPSDVALLKGIQGLLYTEGYSIRGVQKLIKEQGVRAISSEAPPPTEENELPPEEPLIDLLPQEIPEEAPSPTLNRNALLSILAELESLRKLLKHPS